MERSNGDLRALARQQLSGKWGMSLLVSLVAGLLGASDNQGSGILSRLSDVLDLADDILPDHIATALPVSSLFAGSSLLAVSALILALALWALGCTVLLGRHRYFIGLIAGEKPPFDTLFSRFPIFLKALGLNLFTGLLVLAWSLPTIVLFVLAFLLPAASGLLAVLALVALILPILASLRYSQATYLMAQYPEKGIRESIEDSKALMQGQKWRYFVLGLSFMGWALLCVLTLFIGFLWLDPYMHATFSAFYLERTGQLDPEPQPEA